MTLSDKEIKKRILDDLYWDSSIDTAKVTVLVDNGKVTLGGTVPGFLAKDRATEAAWRIMDVTSVTNQIIVKLPVGVPSDADTRQSIIQSLAAAAGMEKTDIKVQVKNGMVTLEGSVDQYWQKVESGRVACRVRGVCEMKNKVTVVPTGTVSDKAVADDVRAAIDRNANGSSDCVTVKVEKGIVTLSGSVPSWLARTAALSAAEFTRGVIDVRDLMTVASAAARAAGTC